MRTEPCRGFTLIELLVVIAIIGILSSVVIASLNTARAKSRDARRLADMHQLRLALEMYRDTAGSYPSNSGARANSCFDGGGTGDSPGVWSNSLQPLVTMGYLGALPADPLNNTLPKASGGTYPQYCYVYNRSNSTTTIYDSCFDTQTGDIIYPGDYEYFLFLSLEKPPAKRWRVRWANDTIGADVSSVSNYCVLGPHR